VFGLAEETEGVIVGLGSDDQTGLVLEMEYRRKSGRGVKEWFFLPLDRSKSSASEVQSGPQRPKATIILLEDHPLYSPPTTESDTGGNGEDIDTTFSLGLTEKQRRDREGVVLPYFDAQRDEGPGEGGRILYEMSAEDDFDEEEDEI
jgi:elongator complex protein 5